MWLTIHFSLVWQDNFATPTGGVNCKSLLETLLNVRGPDTFGISAWHLLIILDDEKYHTLIWKFFKGERAHLDFGYIMKPQQSPLAFFRNVCNEVGKHTLTLNWLGQFWTYGSDFNHWPVSFIKSCLTLFLRKSYQLEHFFLLVQIVQNYCIFSGRSNLAHTYTIVWLEKNCTRIIGQT